MPVHRAVGEDRLAMLSCVSPDGVEVALQHRHVNVIWRGSLLFGMRNDDDGAGRVMSALLAH